MTTDIELAQSLKRRATYANEFGESLYVKAEDILALVEALEKAQAAERRWHRVASRIHEQACESDVKIDELEAIRAAAEKLVRCKGRYHSEQNYRALAALFGVKTPDLPPLEHENVHYADAAEIEIAALRQRIAELEEAEQKLCAANITLDARAELAERQLAEMESRTVKLPDALLPATHKSGELFMTPDNVEQGGYLNRDDVLRVLRAAGIKVEAE